MNKPIKAKPLFYSVCLFRLQQIAIEHGYNLILHVSMNRDLDLVAIPWVNPKKHIELLDSMCEYLGVLKDRTPDGDGYYMNSKLDGGRHSYVINLNRGGKFNGYLDEEYYLDISITPLPNEIEDSKLSNMKLEN